MTAIRRDVRTFACLECGGEAFYSGGLCEACHEIERKNRRRRERRAAFLRMPGGEENQNASFDSFLDNSRALARAQGFVQSVLQGERPDLYFLGPVGRGKTYLAVACCLALLEIDAWDGSCAIVRATDFVLRLHRTFRQDEQDPLLVIEQFARPDVLILDDLCAESWTPYAMSKLYELISRRARRSTIYTSNSSLDELVHAYSGNHHVERIASRIHSKATFVKFTGPEHRGLRRRS